MPDRDGTGDHRTRVLGELLRGFAEGGGFPGFPALALMRPFLEAQRAFFGWYQQAVDGEGSTHAFEDQARSMARGFLHAYLEFVQTQREERRALMQAQSEFLTMYLAIVDEVLGRPDADKA